MNAAFTLEAFSTLFARAAFLRALVVLLGAALLTPAAHASDVDLFSLLVKTTVSPSKAQAGPTLDKLLQLNGFNRTGTVLDEDGVTHSFYAGRHLGYSVTLDVHDMKGFPSQIVVTLRTQDLLKTVRSLQAALQQRYSASGKARVSHEPIPATLQTDAAFLAYLYAPEKIVPLSEPLVLHKMSSGFAVMSHVRFAPVTLTERRELILRVKRDEATQQLMVSLVYFLLR